MGGRTAAAKSSRAAFIGPWSSAEEKIVTGPKAIKNEMVATAVKTAKPNRARGNMVRGNKGPATTDEGVLATLQSVAESVTNSGRDIAVEFLGHLKVFFNEKRMFTGTVTSSKAAPTASFPFPPSGVLWLCFSPMCSHTRRAPCFVCVDVLCCVLGVHGISTELAHYRVCGLRVHGLSLVPSFLSFAGCVPHIASRVLCRGGQQSCFVYLVNWSSMFRVDLFISCFEWVRRGWGLFAITPWLF